MCYMLPRITPFNPNGDNYPRFASKMSKLRLREVKRLTNSNFPGTLPVLQLKVPCLRSPSVPGKLGHLVTLGISNPPKELDPRDSSPDPMPIPKPFSTTLCCASGEIDKLERQKETHRQASWDGGEKWARGGWARRGSSEVRSALGHCS